MSILEDAALEWLTARSEDPISWQRLGAAEASLAEAIRTCVETPEQRERWKQQMVMGYKPTAK